MEEPIYRVRVLYYGGKEVSYDNLNWIQAKRKFIFFVQACLEFDNQLPVRCINIFRNNVSLRYYQNYGTLNRPYRH